MIMLSIGMVGLYSMSTIQSRQTGRLNAVLPEDESEPAFNQAESEWARKLGVYTTIDEKLEKSDEPESLIPVQVIQDDSHPKVKYRQGGSDWWGWTTWNHWPAYGGFCEYHYSQGNVGTRVEYKVEDLPKNRYYEVLITYPALQWSGGAIPVEIYDDNKIVASVTLNQKVPPADATYAGANWHSLGTYYFKHDKIKIRLLDGPASRYYILADAVLVRSPRPLNVLSLGPTATGGATVTVEELP